MKTIKDYNSFIALIENIVRKQLLAEGGAGGHMRHPFDLDDVKTGDDLTKKFEQIGSEIRDGNRPDTKIDGVNTSIKIIDTPEGKKYAMDRGSSKSIDVEGITVDRLPERFSAGHGMIPAGENVLGIFNDALKEGAPELKELGVLDDPTKFFNMEYVKGTTNVLAYDHDFIKIHGVNQFYEKKNRKGEPVRPGLERPIDSETNKAIKDPSVPVAYDQEVMDKLVEKLNKYADKYGFKVYASIPSKTTGDFDFSPVMSVPVPVTYSTGDIREATLGERLKQAKNRIKEKVRTADGRKPPAQGKEIYKAVLGASAQDTNANPQRQIPLDKLLASEEDYQKAIDGAVFWHATRLLGNVIMSNMEVDHPAVKGPATEHEGLVIRLSGDNFDTKITGEFILGGEATSFRAADPEPAEKITKKTTGLFPGSFKPPHRGHYSVAKALQNIPNIGQVVVLISAPSKAVRSSRVTPEKAKKIWEAYINAETLGIGVEIEISSEPSPIRAAYRYIEETAEDNETVYLATSTADSNYYPQKSLDKSASKNANGTVEAKPFIVQACRGEGCDTVEKMSAGNMRKIIDKYPDITEQEKQYLFDHMHPNLSKQQKQNIFDLLTGEQMEEASLAGAISGPAGGFMMKKRKRKKMKTSYSTMNEQLNFEEKILKNHLVEKLMAKYKKSLLGEYILEAKETDVTSSTGVNFLAVGLKKILKNLKSDYMVLAREDQRESFRRHYIEFIAQGFAPIDVMKAVGNEFDDDTSSIPTEEPTVDIEEPTMPGVDQLEEQEKVTLDIEDEEDDEFLDPTGEVEKATVAAEKDDEQLTDVGGESRPFPSLQGLDPTGAKAARTAYRRDAPTLFAKYKELEGNTAEDVRERKMFKTYALTNLKLHFDNFEREIRGEAPERTTPEYEQAAQERDATIRESTISGNKISNIIVNSVKKTFAELDYK